MKSKFIINLSLAALSIANVVLIVSAAQAQIPDVVPCDDPNNPECQLPPPPRRDDTNYKSTEGGNEEVSVNSVECSENKRETLAVVTGGEKPGQAVLFKWNTNFFGTNYPPEVRCQIVSKKLNSFVQANNGQFTGLKFTTGLMNNYPVICTIRPGESSCNSQNLLFTLRPENRAKTQEIIRNLEDPNSYGSFSINEARRPVVDFGAWVKRNLRPTRQNSINRRYQPNPSRTVPSSRPRFR